MATQKKQKQTKSESISESKGQNTEGMGPLIETLVADLASHDDRTREKARHTFVAMGKDAVQSLIEALKDKRYLMRWEAAKAWVRLQMPTQHLPLWRLWRMKRLMSVGWRQLP